MAFIPELICTRVRNEWNACPIWTPLAEAHLPAYVMSMRRAVLNSLTFRYRVYPHAHAQRQNTAEIRAIYGIARHTV